MQTAPRRLGRYEILSSLAQGGMAELFVARLAGIEGFAKRVVLKRVLPTLARDRQLVEMFLEEARLAATLHHQNVVQVLDIGEDADGYFFAMELLHGGDVGDVLRTAHELPLGIALELARGACAGLHYAHERASPTGAPLGIVHRDVSPQNLFVTFDGSMKVLDFGIAKAVHQIQNHYTRSGTLRGKLPYMSPEQCQGEPIDRRSDIFSMAIVLWEMTVGERLFGADGQSDFEILKSIVERDAPTPSSRKPGYPPALEQIVMKGLTRDRDKRYQTADELQADLEAYMRQSGSWASARDVATYMRELFPQRAAEWQRAERVQTAPVKGEVVPFPRPVTRVVSQPDTTIDLPRDRLGRPSSPPASVPPSAAAAPSAPAAVAPSAPVAAPVDPSIADPTPTTRRRRRARDDDDRDDDDREDDDRDDDDEVRARDRRSSRRREEPKRRGLGFVLLALGVVALVGGAGIGGYLMRGSTPQGGATRAGKAKGSSVIASAPREPGSEDTHWFQPDDFLVSGDAFKGGRMNNVRVAKMTREPSKLSARHEAMFLSGGGVEVTTEAYWKTRAATADDLEIGRLAFCFTEPSWADQATAPPNKQSSRTGNWSVGKVTDTSDLPNDHVTVANIVCDLDAVRVVDEPPAKP